MRCRVPGFGFRVSVFRVYVLGSESRFRVSDVGLRILEVRVQRLGGGTHYGEGGFKQRGRVSGVRIVMHLRPRPDVVGGVCIPYANMVQEVFASSCTCGVRITMHLRSTFRM